MSRDALSQQDTKRVLELFGQYPEVLSGSDHPPGGPIDEDHPLFHSIGEILGDLPSKHPIRVAWNRVKTRSRKVSKRDGDGEPAGTRAEVRVLRAAVSEFKRLLCDAADLKWLIDEVFAQAIAVYDQLRPVREKTVDTVGPGFYFESIGESLKILRQGLKRVEPLIDGIQN